MQHETKLIYWLSSSLSCHDSVGELYSRRSGLAPIRFHFFCFSFWFLSSLFSVKYGDYICIIFLGFVHAFLNTLLGVWSDTYMYIFVHINILFCQLYVTISCDIFMSQLESNDCCSTMNFNYSFMFAHNDVCFKLQPDCRAYIDGQI